MTVIDADKFLSYLIFSKHIDSLSCGEVKEAVEMCKVDVLDKIRAEIKEVSSAEPRYYPPCEDCHKKMNEIREVYDKIQSAEPKTGHWIKEPNCYYRCSECGEHYPSMRGYMENNYCPNCGTKMVEPQEGRKYEKRND